MVLFDDRLFISADDGDDAGHELWVSDGTPDGTTLFKDFYPGSEDLAPTFVGMMGDLLFLGAGDSTTGTELRGTDGTPEGTTLVKDLSPGEGGSWFYDGAVLGSNLIFSAYDENFNSWLWRTDGTEAGTVLVVDDHTLTADEFTPANNVLFFEGYHPDSGYELWQTDGSAEGTFLVADIYPGATSSYPGYFTEFEGKLFFSARDEE